MIATRINWDIDDMAIRNHADNLASNGDFRQLWNIDVKTWNSMTSKEQDGLIRSIKNKEKAARFLGLPTTVFIPEWLEEGDIIKWLYDEFGFICKGYEPCESVKYTATEAANLKARVRLFLNQIGDKWQTMDEFSDDVCDSVAESIMTNNFEAVLPEDIDEETVMRELLNLLIFKTT